MVLHGWALVWVDGEGGLKMREVKTGGAHRRAVVRQRLLMVRPVR